MLRYFTPVGLAAVIALSGCSAGSETGQGTSNTGAEAPASRLTSTNTAKQAVDGPTAQAVVDAFDQAGLPVPKARDNSKNCASLGCTNLITTDAISVYTWPDTASAEKHAVAAGDQAFRAGNVVLSYAAAPTPEKNRPKYEKELKRLLG